MATNFPTSLDALSNPNPTTLLNAAAPLTHSGQHANANDAIEALEAKVGVNSSAVTTSHDYLLRANGIQTCTSGARGTALRTGQIKFETDTARFIVWDGSAWQRFQWTSAASRTGTALRRAANQSLTNGAATTISWDTEDFDSDAFIAVPATTITIPSGQAGVYAMSAYMTLPGVTYTRLSISMTAAGVTWTTTGGTIESFLSVAAIIPMTAGQTVSVSVFQTSGAARNATGNLWLYRLAV